MSIFQAIDLAIELAFLFPVALAAFNVVAKRRKATDLSDIPLQKLWDECSADDGAWLAEVQQPQFVPNPDQCESTPEEQALVDAHAAYVAQYWANVPTDNVVPFVRKSFTITEAVEAFDWAKLDPFQLRSACSLHGIRWRNANGRNKHLTKKQMVAALGAIG